MKLLGETDEDVNSATFSGAFPCNASVRLTSIRNLRENGYSFMQWDSPLPSPAPQNMMGSTYNAYPIPATLTAFNVLMNEDKSAKASFRQNFFLRKIGIYADKATQPEWFDVKDMQFNTITNLDVFANTASTRQGALAPNSKFGTKIGLEFSEAVQQSTVSGAVECTEVSERCDRREKERYISDGSNLNWTDSKTVLMNLYPTSPSSSGPFGIPAGERFSIDVNTGIQNLLGENLDPASVPKIWAMTELPNVSIVYGSLKPLTEFDNWSHPEFHSIGTVRAYRESNLIGGTVKRIPTDYEENQPCSTYIEVGDRHTYGYVLHRHLDPTIKDHITTDMQVLDVDSDSGPPCMQTPNEFEVIFGVICLVVGAALVFTGSIAIGATLLYYFTDRLAKYFPNEADNAGANTWGYNWEEHWFGTRPGVNKTFSNQKIEIDMRFDLYTD